MNHFPLQKAIFFYYNQQGQKVKLGRIWREDGQIKITGETPELTDQLIKFVQRLVRKNEVEIGSSTTHKEGEKTIHIDWGRPVAMDDPDFISALYETLFWGAYKFQGQELALAYHPQEFPEEFPEQKKPSGSVQRKRKEGIFDRLRRIFRP
jgi:hypothetical protein